jgi:uncharacterized protein
MEIPKCNFESSALPRKQRWVTVETMIHTARIFVGVVFLLAGFVKGVVGLGLPTISTGLLAIAMPPVDAAEILLLPSFVTNVWQMLAGRTLRIVCRRLWSMMFAVCVGTWTGLGLMTGASAKFGTALLGVALVIYAIIGLGTLRLSAPKAWEPILSPLVGGITGLITAARGVFVVPAVPYLRAIGLEKEELVQALGLSFTVSTLALAVNVGVEGGLRVSMGRGSIVALALGCLGMWIGQSVRQNMSPNVFRRWYFLSLLLLGLYLVERSAI